MNYDDGKPKQTQLNKIYQYKDNLSFWPETFFEQSNPLARSSVFVASAKSKTTTYFKKYTPLNVVGEGNIEYRGAQLFVFDETVFLTLLNYLRGQTLLRPLDVSKKSLLEDMGFSNGGKNHKKLIDALDRLDSGSLKISSRHVLKKLSEFLLNPHLQNNMNPEFVAEMQSRYGKFVEAIDSAAYNNEDFFITVKFFQNYGCNPDNGKLIIQLDPLLVLLYDGINTTRTDKFERRHLTPTETRLLTYIHSHEAEVFTLKLETIHELIGSTTNLERSRSVFMKTITKSLETLERLQRIVPGWSVTNEHVIGLKAIPYKEDLLTSP